MRATAGQGSLFLSTKRAKGHEYLYWVAQWTVTDENGKRKHITGSAPASLGEVKAKALAIQRRNAKLQKLMSGGEALVREQRTPKLSSYVDVWLNSYPPGKLADDGRQKYKRDFELHILPFYDPMLHQITESDLERLFYRTLPAKARSARSIYNAYRALGTLLKFASSRGKVLDENPLKHVEVKRPASQVSEDDDKWINRRVSMTKNLLKWLSDPTSADNQWHHAYPRILLMFLGLRRAELLGLEWACFHNLDRKGKATFLVKQQLKRKNGGIWYIHPSTKNKKPRVIPLPELWRKALVELRNQEQVAAEDWARDLVFLTPSGRHVDYNTHSGEWRQILSAYVNHRKKVKAPIDSTYYFRPHAARHVTASMLFDQGVQLEVAQEILGHSDKAITMYYTHLTRAKKQAAVQALEEGLNGARRREND